MLCCSALCSGCHFAMDQVAAFEDSVLCSGRCFSLVESPKTRIKPSIHLPELCFLPWPHFVFAKSPETNTTNTAAYAAVPAKMASRFALVVTLKSRANKTIKVITSASRAFGFVTKYKTTIGHASRNAAMVMLKEVTTHERRWSLKCRNLSTSCGDRRYGWLARL
jgi:hypothetical protein